MSKRTNGLIAEWLGHEVDGINAKHPEFGWYKIPDYTRLEYAVTLIPILSERGYKAILESSVSGENVGYIFRISKDRRQWSALQLTVGDAIVDVMMRLIESI